jgi:leader peptidase (prepilin peptidase)/N-methyltransferase
VRLPSQRGGAEKDDESFTSFSVCTATVGSCEKTHFGGSEIVVGRLPGAPALCFLAAHLVIAVITDLRTRRIPNRLVMSLAAGGLFAASISGSRVVVERLLGGLAGMAVFTLIAACVKGAVGGGDIKLMAAAGLYLGPCLVLRAMAWTFIAGGVISLTMLGIRKTTLRGAVPYAPAIAIGVLAAIATAI